MSSSMKRHIFVKLYKTFNRATFQRFLRSSAQLYNESTQSDSETHFGFEYVSEKEKERRVYEVFKNVAEKYDLMNDTMSLGVHRLWKDAFVRRLAPVPGMKHIDMAGGTGDIAFRIKKFIQNMEDSSSSTSQFDIPPIPDLSVESLDHQEDSAESVNSSQPEDHTHITVCDINQEMLDVGKEKGEAEGIVNGFSWIQANAEDLPMEDNSFDAYTIAFGIRNCTHIDMVLSEAYRVLKPGGRFMCLEFSHVNNPLLQSVYDTYSFQVIPVMGQVIASDWKSYQYLVESIRQFPNQDEFASMIRRAGFRMVSYENLTFGVAAIHSGFKLRS